MEPDGRQLGLTAAQQAMVDLWQAHVAAEFQARNVQATLDTMTADPHLLLIPVRGDAAAGMEGVRTFYTQDLIPSVSEAAAYELIPISRTVGEDRIVDEMIFKFTHGLDMPWILPGVPPTGKRVEIPLVAIVTFKDGKIDSEHLYWDQASVLVQIGLLQTDRLPVVGAEAARRLAQLSAGDGTSHPEHGALATAGI